MRIVAVPGSTKASSANCALVRDLAERAPDVIVPWEDVGALPHFTPDDDGGDAVASLRRAVTDADGVLIATPEYAGGMPGVLKNALDWLVGSGELYGKRVVVVSAAPAPERGGNARQWVEQVTGYQGATMLASFTVAPGDDRDAVAARVLDAFST